MYLNSVSLSTLQNLDNKMKYATSPIKPENKPSTDGYAPVTANLWGAKQGNSVAWNYGAFIPDFGRISNNPANLDSKEADTQSGFKLSQLTHPLTCPDCGKPIMTKPIFTAIKEELNNADEKTYLSVVESHSEFLYPQEQKILKNLQTVQKKNPDAKITDIVKNEREKRLDKLERQQFKVLDKLEEMAEVLPYEDRSKIHGLIDMSSKIIFQRQNTYAFQRSKFIELADNLDLSKPETKAEVHKLASKLPSSMNNEDAWYVKYGGLDNKKKERTSRDIAERLIAPTYTNTDHIHPHDLGGLDAVSNFWLMHARCNIIKTNKPFNEWLNEDKENRIQYIKQYLTEAQNAIDESTDKKIHPKYDNYAAKIAKTIKEETKGEVDFTEDFPLPEGEDISRPVSDKKKVA